MFPCTVAHVLALARPIAELYLPSSFSMSLRHDFVVSTLQIDPLSAPCMKPCIYQPSTVALGLFGDAGFADQRRYRHSTPRNCSSGSTHKEMWLRAGAHAPVLGSLLWEAHAPAAFALRLSHSLGRRYHGRRAFFL
eukprot:6179223-Pleurochrysis_carterae.AAC.2